MTSDVKATPTDAPKAAAWSAIGLFSKQALRIGSTLILAPLLGPTNFGIVGQATILIAFSLVLLDLGVGAALIQRPNLTKSEINTASTVNLIATIALVGLGFLAGPVMAWFFRTPELTGVVRVLSVTFLFVGLSIVPNALLLKGLRFRAVAIIEMVSNGAGLLVGIVSALQGAGYWAIVAQQLATTFVAMVAALIAAGLPRYRFDRASWGDIRSFSGDVLVSRLLDFGKSNADNILIGRFLGAAPLAHYAFAYRVLLLPVQLLTQTVNRLCFPILSKRHEEGGDMVGPFLRFTTSLSIAVVPLMALLALSAERLIDQFFGPDWGPAAQPMQILAVASILRSIGPLVGTLILASGFSRFAMKWSIFSAFVTIVGFAIGVRWGVVGVAWSYLIGGIPMQLLYLTLANERVAFGLLAYARSLLPATVCVAALLLGWTATSSLVPDDLGILSELVVFNTSAALCYLAAFAFLFRSLFAEHLRMARSVITR